MKLKALSHQWVRSLLILVFIAGNFYVLSDKPVIKWISLVILILAIGFILSAFISVVGRIAKNLHKIFFKVQWKQKVIPEFAPLVKQMGIRLDKKYPMGIVPDWTNAAALPNNRIILGKPLLDHLDKSSVQAVVAHELAHLKKNHYFKQFIMGIFVAFAIALYQSFFLSICDLMACTLSLVLISLVFSLMSWHFEYEADSFAKDYVGSEALISKLQNLRRITEKDIDSFTHPSFSKRIARLQRKE